MVFKRRISALLVIALLCTAAFSGDSIPVFASETSSGSTYIDTSELEDQRQDTLDKIDELESSLSQIKSAIEALEESKSSLKSYIAELDEQANTLSAQIDELNAEIDAKLVEIEETKEELAEAEATAEKQYEDMKTRIQYMYENGSPSYLELLLTSESMADFLNKSSYASQMTEYDRDMLEKYIAQTEAIEAAKALLEEEEAELELMAETAEEQKETIEALIDSKTAQIASYQAQINSQSSSAAEYEADLEEQEALLDQIEEQIAAAAAANALAGDGDGGASGLIWPCPSSHRITSYFGPREQPTAGASTNHKGIDIGASYGAAIVAAASGRVTTATYSSSAGNYIVISHGDGLSTVYMHCSALYVSVGDYVTQGETIAAVGSTGYSTGNHLHFGVIVNGSYVNPLNYVS